MSTTTETQELLDRLQTFLRRYYKDDLAILAQNYPSSQSLAIDWMELYAFDRDVAEDVLEQPDIMLDYLAEAVRLYDQPIDLELSDVQVQVENARREALAINETRSEHVGEYIAVNGQVAKTSAVHPKLVDAAFECQRCGTKAYIGQTGEGLQEPHECQGCERQGPFTIDYSESEFVNHQAIRLQEPPEKSKGGEGEHLDVDVVGDLVGVASPGDRVDLSGIYRVSPPSGKEKSTRLTPYLDGRAIEIEQADFEEIEVDEYLADIDAIASGEDGDPYELLKQSIAPKVHGMDDIKEALILQLFGGWRHIHPDGNVDRGDSHVLLVGDPGSGKSTLLRAVEEISPRSVFASGKGLTKAGATAAAVRDNFGDTEWGLEAGALVLANKGVACIDEIDKVNEDAVASLHSALESQRVSINKAGINATLPAQTALLAAGNPTYGRFDENEGIAQQIDLAPTLISRFDLIFIVTDDPDKEEDREIAEHIIRSRQTIGKMQQGRDVDDADREAIEPALDRDLMRAYVAHAKQSVYPTIDDPEVEEALVDFFTDLRSIGGPDSPVPVTFRKLEAIQRLAEASARVRLSQTVEREDVRRAISLVRKTMQDVGVDPETGQLDVDVIETGSSKTQRDRIKTVRTLIAEVSSDYEQGAPVDEVLERAEDIGIEPSKAEHEIDKLRDRGEAYEPSTGHLRLT